MTEIKNDDYRLEFPHTITRITQIKEKYPTSKEQLRKRDDDFLERYSTEFGINLKDPFISQNPRISRIDKDILECYMKVITYYLEYNCVEDGDKYDGNGIRLSDVLRELDPEITQSQVKRLQQQITKQRDQNQRPRIFTPIVAGVLERADIRARHKMSGMYRLTNRKKAERYLGFLDEIIEFYNVINTKK